HQRLCISNLAAGPASHSFGRHRIRRRIARRRRGRERGAGVLAGNPALLRPPVQLTCAGTTHGSRVSKYILAWRAGRSKGELPRQGKTPGGVRRGTSAPVVIVPRLARPPPPLPPLLRAHGAGRGRNPADPPGCAK